MFGVFPGTADVMATKPSGPGHLQEFCLNGNFFGAFYTF